MANISRTTIMRRSRFWTISIPFALALVAQVGFIVHQIALLEPSIGHANAGFAVGLMTFMAMFALGMVIDRFNPRLITAASLVSQAGAKRLRRRSAPASRSANPGRRLSMVFLLFLYGGGAISFLGAGPSNSSSSGGR